MLDLFGTEYIIEHVVSEINSQKQEEIYRQYVTEVLRACAKGSGIDFSPSYLDVKNSIMVKAPEEERSADDIISTIKRKAEAIA